MVNYRRSEAVDAVWKPPQTIDRSARCRGRNVGIAQNPRKIRVLIKRSMRRQLADREQTEPRRLRILH
jgi:hypothetical protein